MIWDLGAPLEVKEPVVEEVALSIGTCSKGKGCESKVAKETEEEELYDLSVSNAIVILY